MPTKEIIMVRPKFRISLTAEQTLEVGRLSVIWGQIDHLLISSLSLLLTVDFASGAALMGDLTTGPLVNLLKKARHKIEDDEIQKLIVKFCDDMGPLIASRNHIMHGMWGFYLPGKNPKHAKPGCLFIKDPIHPIFPDKVTEVANKAAEQTHLISKIWHYLSDREEPEGQPSYYFGQHEPRVPKGLKLVPVAQPQKGHRRKG